MGMPVGGGEPLQADNVLCHLGGEETLESFTENLRGANPGDNEAVRVDAIPTIIPIRSWPARPTTMRSKVLGIKEKKLPELNDEFAKDAAGEHGGDCHARRAAHEDARESGSRARISSKTRRRARRCCEELVQAHDFPVPEALVESQMDARLERAVRSLAAQGVDPRAVNVDWVATAPAPARPRRRRREGRIAARPHRHGGKYRSDRRRCGKGNRSASPNAVANRRQRCAPA